MKDRPDGLIVAVMLAVPVGSIESIDGLSKVTVQPVGAWKVGFTLVSGAVPVLVTMNCCCVPVPADP